MNEQLYEQDYNLWVEHMVSLLKSRIYDEVDWLNLIEELEDRRNQHRERAVKSYLLQITQHLLQIKYWKGERPRAILSRKGTRKFGELELHSYWKSKIVSLRMHLLFRLEESPSLKTRLEKFFGEVLPRAKRAIAYFERICFRNEATERFVYKAPLRQVHECVFGVLALESEPVNPRL